MYGYNQSEGNPSQPYERGNPEETIVAFDCDGTLIAHRMPEFHWDTDPDGGESFTVYKYFRGYAPRPEVVNALVAYAAMPNVRIVVWSYGGENWARQVARECGVLELADEVWGKIQYGEAVARGEKRVPHIYYDDNGIGAFGDVWIDVDPNYGTQHDSLAFPDWTEDEYTLNPPCRYCELQNCTKELCVEKGKMTEYRKGHLRSHNDPTVRRVERLFQTPTQVTTHEEDEKTYDGLAAWLDKDDNEEQTG